MNRGHILYIGEKYSFGVNIHPWWSLNNKCTETKRQKQRERNTEKKKQGNRKIETQKQRDRDMNSKTKNRGTEMEMPKLRNRKIKGPRQKFKKRYKNRCTHGRVVSHNFEHLALTSSC